MDSINLNRIMEEPEVTRMIQNLSRATNRPLCILDHENQVVYSQNWQIKHQSDSVEDDRVCFFYNKSIICLKQPIWMGQNVAGHILFGQYFSDMPDRETLISKLKEENISDETAHSIFNNTPIAAVQSIQEHSVFLELLSSYLSARLYDSSQKVKQENLENLKEERRKTMASIMMLIAHQWRTPLNSLDMILQGLSRKMDDYILTGDTLNLQIKKAREILGQLSNSIDNLAGLLGPGNVTVPFNIKKSVDTVLQITKEFLNSRKIETEPVLTENLTGLGMESEFSQAVLEILLNSEKNFAERNTAAPKIFLKSFKKDSKIILTITDNGGGVTKEIFEPRFTADNSGSSARLYLAKSAIEEKMKGRMTVENITHPNGEKGAEFTIELVGA